MTGFFSAMLSEIAARRRRMRKFFGDRSHSVSEFLLMGGVVIGSLGLLVRPWMPPAAPWGFALPFLLVLGHLALEWRRQRQPAIDPALYADRDDDEGHPGDWIPFLWSLACAVGGAAAFVIAWSAQPAPVEEEVWTPPVGSVGSTIVPEE
jgi:hypothetical protein